MLKKIQIMLTVLPLLFVVELALGERVYEYEVTVGQSPGYDHNNINAAIVDVNENRSSENALACIWVYPGTYEEQLHDPYKYTAPAPPDGDGQEHWFNLGCHNLPVNCDLQKPESETGVVKIIHSAPPAEGGIQPNWHIGQCGVNCNGNNFLEGLTVENWYGSSHPGHYVQTSVGMNGYGEIRDCILITGHGPAIAGSEAGIIVSGCTVERCYFVACIGVGGPFSISDCVLNPTWTWDGERPGGIAASASGTIERVVINGISQSAASSHNDYGFFGIQLTLQANEYVEIFESEINLEMRTKYDTDPLHKPQSSRLRACGILSGRSWTNWSGDMYPGNAVVRDCKISVTGIEDDGGTPETGDDGADILVDGVCVRGGGTVEVLGCSRIKTKRVPAGEQTAGYEYLLNNEDGQNGTLITNRATVLFNPNGVDPPDDYDPQYINGNITELWNWDRAFCVKNALGESVAWFDRCGTLILTGELTWAQPIGSAPANSYIIKNAGDDIVGYFDNQGNLFIEGNWQKMCATCNPAINALIIRNKSDKNVSYINFGGNLCLTGELRENVQP